MVSVEIAERELVAGQANYWCVLLSNPGIALSHQFVYFFFFQNNLKEILARLL
jgi:hypothetical protein